MKKFMLISLVLLITLSLMGCNANTQSPSNNSPSNESQKPAADDTSKSSRQLTRMLLGTSSAGGTYYVLGGGWSKIINNKVNNVEVGVEVTGGPNTNIQLIEKGEMELGYATTWLAGEAFAGEGWAQGEKYQEIRAMFPMYSSVLYIYTLKDKGIKSVYDFEGKNISVGAPGATSELAGRAVLDVLGIKPKSISSLPSDAQINALKDGTVDANFGVTGLPAPWLLDLETTHEVEYIPLSQEDMGKILKEYPYWSQGVVPDKTYKHQTGDIPVITFWNMSVCDKDITDDIVYDLVKTTFESLEELVAIDPTSKSTIPENVANCTIPLHPGALKYYKEKGINVPEKLISK
ncbi:TAXI family TRAP transporter solute-binding subunit [Petroclostridium sp. X23]|uniref:TAXI family TRAP transporter solute-binding subunit n=1 Tax=Petroclostridium sp. X23 TaxID=3045146 RepID=UPI0024ACB437|nr:TAXI family TRAP transporter solute-binding subunit [Petroclostridium sp. X23]WHH58213.1 TAXI family TRAP transporter solute-binding subunit [Petroclostridium sp. X23]